MAAAASGAPNVPLNAFGAATKRRGIRVRQSLLPVPIELSLPEARRLAVASQGFGRQPAQVAAEDVLDLARQIHAFQIDSVNVLIRAHYVPAFARLGAYRQADLDELVYERRELFEYWGHAACLLPVSLYPLLRYRMNEEYMRGYMETERGAYFKRVFLEVQERGPLATADLSDPGRRAGKWWGWGQGKLALELLLMSGVLAVAGRRSFERRYDLRERVIPAAALEAPAPPREESMKQLICLGARACGIGTLGDIAGYFYVDGWGDRTPLARHLGEPAPDGGWRTKPIAKRLAAELVESGRLVPCRVEGWKEAAYLHPGTEPAAAVNASALLTPFDSLVWERSRIDRLFGMKYTIEIYTPAPKRVYGYYVLPFLLGDTLVGRVDLKADRKAGSLLVPGAFLEPGQPARKSAGPLAQELRRMAAWLGLERIQAADRGDLAPALRLELAAAPGSRRSSTS